MLEKPDGVVAVQCRQAEGHFLSTDDIQRAIKMDTVALWRDPHRGRLANRRPDARQAGLQLGTHLVQRQNQPSRVVLHKVGHFFSSSASKSAISGSLGRDL